MISAQGIGSGLDVASIVAQLVAAEGQPASLRLSRREASIQAELSALGSLKGALSSFRDSLASLKDIELFRSRRAASDNTDLFTAAANADAVPSAYEIEVLNLAESHKLASGAFASADSQLGGGTLLITSGTAPEDTFAVVVPDNASTLEDIRDAINDHADNPGVGAAIVTANAGAHLVLTSTRTGVEFEISIAASGGTGSLDVFDYGNGVPASTMTEVRAAADANILIDSFAYTSSSNTLSDVIDGVTISLASAEPGTIGTLSIAYDQAAATGKVRDFVEAYNSLVGSLQSLSSYNAETGVAGALLGDSNLREVSAALRREIGGGIRSDGVYQSLSAAGVTAELDGDLTLDESALAASLEADFDSIGRLFASADGFAVRLDTILEPFLGTDGRLDNRTDGLEKSIDLIEQQREALNLRLASVEERYLRQFSALDSIISELSNTSNFLAQQLSVLPLSNFNS